MRYALAQAEAAGCTEAVVVIGYEGARVRRAVEAIATSITIRFVESPDPTAPERTLAAGRGGGGGALAFSSRWSTICSRFRCSAKLAAAAMRQSEVARLLVDRAPVGLDLNDATKVRLEAERIVAIGKGLEPWDAIDTGVFLLTRAVFDAIRRVPSSEPLTVSSAMRRLARNGSFRAVDIGGVPWVDVDTPADRHDAEQRLADVGAPGAG